jgi:hydrogenase-1 operon protein HyaF
MSLRDIPITVQGPSEGAGMPAGVVEPLLREIVELLGRLAAGGKGGIVDLGAMPLAPAEIEALRQRLGTGEVRATLEVSGPTEVTETAYAGVWWVTHRNVDGHLVAEQVEVARVPAILAAHEEDVGRARDRLSSELGRES